jgi:FAD synthase
MVTFDSIDALTAQMADDVERCRALLSAAPAGGS